MADIQRLQPGELYSGAVIHGDTVWLSGKVASDTSGGIQDQTRDVLGQIDATLEACGTSKSRLLSVQIWLTDNERLPRPTPENKPCPQRWTAALGERWSTRPRGSIPDRGRQQSRCSSGRNPATVNDSSSLGIDRRHRALSVMTDPWTDETGRVPGGDHVRGSPLDQRQAVEPPSTASSAPVMNFWPGSARKQMASPISSGSAILFIGEDSSILLMASGSSPAPSMSVMTDPGQTAFTRISGARSWAKARVMFTTAPFEVQ